MCVSNSPSNHQLFTALEQILSLPMSSEDAKDISRAGAPETLNGNNQGARDSFKGFAGVLDEIELILQL